MNLEKRVAVITGATGGLGRVIAKRFADAGASLALFSTNEDKLAELAAELSLPNERYLTRSVDLRDPADAQVVVETTHAKFGRADMLLHLVGGWAGGKTVQEFETSEYDVMLQQHFWTTLYLSQAFIPIFTEAGWGRLVVVSSPFAGTPAAKGAPYAVAKAAQETLVLSIAQELKGSNVTANIVRVKTIDVQHQRIQEPSAKNAAWTTPEEIAEGVLYLCSDEAGMVNGARLPMYGSL